MLLKFIITTSVIFNSLTFLADNIKPPQVFSNLSKYLPRKEVEVKKLPLLPDWQFQKAAISALKQARPNFYPIRDWGIETLEVEAKSALIFDSAKDKALYQKESDLVLPIASLTKIMTALVVLESIDTEEIVLITEKAIAGYGDRGGLVLNEEISVENLLYALLMESSNDAAYALAEAVELKTERSFIDLMNEKSRELGFEKTNFTDPSGYESGNVSTVSELAQLVEYSFGESLIWRIMKTPMIEKFSVDRGVRHFWTNTDKLLARLDNVVGGKTGYTEEAGGCLILVINHNEGNLISVVLGTKERFLETERLINWVQEAYQW